MESGVFGVVDHQPRVVVARATPNVDEREKIGTTVRYVRACVSAFMFYEKCEDGQ